jgi:hypothetical protein
MPFVTTTPVNHPFGSAGNIPAASGAYFELHNPGYSTIGANINPDGGAVIRFYGSFDGVNYDDMTLRQMGDDGYTFECSGSSPDNFIGSISSLKSIRFVNKTGSPSPCSVVGVMSAGVSTLEGIENGPAPHRFGNKLFHIGFDASSSTITNSGIYTPSPRHKFVITDLTFGLASAAATSVTFHEGSGTASNPSKWVFSTYCNLPNNSAEQVTAEFNTPHVADNTESTLYLTTSTAVTMRGIIHGYEAEF